MVDGYLKIMVMQKLEDTEAHGVDFISIKHNFIFYKIMLQSSRQCFPNQVTGLEYMKSLCRCI